MKPRIDWWNIFFGILFVVLILGAYQLMYRYGDIPTDVSVWDAIIMTLATFRLTRLVVYDSITGWVRSFFETASPFTFFGTVKTLIHCPWCIGLWFALCVATVYITFPVLWFIVFVLALSGAATLIQLFANILGWSAEYQKLQAIRTQEKK